jgi:hypothetical protein
VTCKVETDIVAREQIAALPQEAAELLPEIWTLLQLTPWAGDSVRDEDFDDDLDDAQTAGDDDTRY